MNISGRKSESVSVENLDMIIAVVVYVTEVSFLINFVKVLFVINVDLDKNYFKFT